MRSIDNPQSAIRNPQLGDSCAVVLVFLGIVLTAATWRSLPGLSIADRRLTIDERTAPQSAIRNPQSAISGVDPNVAPWWELTVLPRVGETLARAIVEHREGCQNSPAFVHPSDLQAVRGIGPKTAQRVAPYIRIANY
ncbi:MAG: ComEA family DNA-binding protein [Planctomycetota bacterium]|jgi:hypothetical protein